MAEMKNYTQAGYDALQKELDFLKNVRREEVKNEVTDDATDPTTETTAPETTEPEAPKAEEPKGELTVKVEGGKVKTWTVINGVTGIYIEANGKIPAVIWTSEEVSAEVRDAFIAELGADPEAKVLNGFGEHKVEYQQNKNKTKTVTFTFTNLAQEEPAPVAEVAETEATEVVTETVGEETEAPKDEEPKGEETEATEVVTESVVEETEPEVEETEPEVEETKSNGKDKKNKKNK